MSTHVTVIPNEESTGVSGVFSNASGSELEDYPQGRPCKVIRKCLDANDPYLVEQGLEEEAPCYLIELDGQILWALIEEVTITTGVNA